MRVHRGIVVAALALLLVAARPADAAFRDWFNFWPISPFLAPKQETPKAGAEENVPPPGGQPGAPIPGGDVPPPPGVQPGFAPGQPGPLGPPPGDQGAPVPPPPPGGQPGQQPGQPPFPPMGGFKPGEPRPPLGEPGREPQKPPFGEPGKEGMRPPFEQGKDGVRPPLGEPGKEGERPPLGQQGRENVLPFEGERKPGIAPNDRRQDGQQQPVGQPGKEGMRPPFEQGRGEGQQGDRGSAPRMDSRNTRTDQSANGNQGSFDEGEQPEEPTFFIDPQQVRQAVTQINQLQAQIRALVKQAKKNAANTKVSAEDRAASEQYATDAQTLLDALTATKSKMQSAKGEDLQEVMQEFWDSRPWEEVNVLRTKIELPKIMAEMEKSFTRTDKLMKQAAVKRLTQIGVNIDQMQADLTAMRAGIANVRQLIAQGDSEGASEAMREFWEEGNHPGEIEGLIQQLRDVEGRARRIRNADLKKEFLSFLAPVFEAITDRDYRGARETLEQSRGELDQLLALILKVRGKSLDSGLKQKFEDFKGRLEQSVSEESPSSSSTDSAAP